MRRKLEQSKMKLSGNLIRRAIVISKKKKKRINLFDERDRLKVSKLKIIYICMKKLLFYLQKTLNYEIKKGDFKVASRIFKASKLLSSKREKEILNCSVSAIQKRWISRFISQKQLLMDVIALEGKSVDSSRQSETKPHETFFVRTF